MVYQGSYDLRRDVDKLKNKTDELAMDYFIQVNSPIFSYEDEVYTPSTLTATAYKSSREITDFFDGIIEIRKSTDNGATYTQVKQVEGHTTSYMLSDTTITHLRVNLYDTDLTLLDFQTIAVVRTTKGGAGQGYDFAYYTTEKTTGVPTPSGDITKLTGDYNEWLQRPKEIDTAHPNVFMSYRTSDEDGDWGSWSTPVKYNAIGERGEDGEGLEMIFCRTEYADGYTLDPSTLNPVQTDNYVPTGWTDDQKGVTSQYCFEYVCMRTKTVQSGSKVAQWGKFTSPKLWATFSEDGKDGKGIELIFARNNNPSTAPTFSNGQNQKSYTGVDRNGRHFADDDFIPDNWTDDQSGVNVNNQCEWVSQRIKKVTNGVASWESFNTPKLWATYSEDGEDGEDAITVMLGNEAQLIPVDKNGNLKTNPQVITISVYCYKGTSRASGTININGISNVFSSKSKVDPTTSNDGSVTLTCTSVPSQITNDEPITVTVDGKTVTKYFTWSKIGDGKDGNAGGTFDFVYYTKNNDTAPSISSSTVIDNNTGKNVVNTWCARPTNVSEQYPYCFGAYRELDHEGQHTGNYSDVYLWAKYGADGKSITDVLNYYSSATAYDNATSTDHNDIWGFDTTYPSTLTRTSDYSTVGQETSGTAGQLYYRFNDKTGLIIEFDVKYSGANDRVSLRDGSTVRNTITSATYGNELLTQFCHFRIEFDNNLCTCTTTNVSKTISASAIKTIYFEAREDDGKVYFKNFRVFSGGWKTDITQVLFNSTNKYLWSKEVTKAGTTIVGESTPIMIAEYGKGGQSISSITEEYALSTTTSQSSIQTWQSTPPTMTATNKYLWNRETINYANPTSSQTSTPKIIGAFGNKGDTGEDGIGVYRISTDVPIYPYSSQNYPDSRFRVLKADVDADLGKSVVLGEHLIHGDYIYEIVLIGSSYYHLGERRMMKGDTGEDGADGKGLEMIFARNNSTTTAPSFVNGQNNKSYTGVDRNGKHFYDDDFLPTNWTDDQQGVNSSNQVEWVSMRVKSLKSDGKTGEWQSFNTPKVWATYSEDGADGDGHQIIYCVTQRESVPSTPTSSTVIHHEGDEINDGLWFDVPIAPSDVYSYCWQSQKTFTNGVWSNYQAPVRYNYYTRDGMDGDKGDKGEKGRDGTELTGDEIMMKISGQDIDAQTIGGIPPNEIITTTLQDSGQVNDPNNHGYYRVLRMGRIAVLTVNDYQWTASSTSQKQTVFTLPTWAKPLVTQYGMSVPQGQVLSITEGGIFRCSPTSTGLNQLAGSFTYIVNNNASYTTTLNVTPTSITTGDSIQITLVGNNTNLRNTPLKIEVNGKIYTKRTHPTTGIVDFQVNLGAGTHRFHIIWEGNSSYDPTDKYVDITVSRASSAVIYKNNNYSAKITRNVRGGEPIRDLLCEININGYIFYQSTDYYGILDFTSVLKNYKGSVIATITTMNTNKCPTTVAGVTLTGTRQTQEYTKSLAPSGVSGDLNSNYGEKSGTWWNYATTGSFANKNDGAYAITDILSSGSSTGNLDVQFTPSLETGAIVDTITVYVRFASLQGWTSLSNGSYDAGDSKIRVVDSNGNSLTGVGEKNFVVNSITRTDCGKWYEVGYQWTNLNISKSTLGNPKVTFRGITNKGGGYGNNSRFGIDFVQLVLNYEA